MDLSGSLNHAQSYRNNFKHWRSEMNLNTITIKKTKAPAMKHPRSTGSKYQDLFNSMKAGHWFTINSKDKMKFNAAGSKYVKGRYSLYKHPTMDCKYVFRLNK